MAHRWSFWSVFLCISQSSIRLQCAASGHILAVSTAPEHKPLQCLCYTDRSGMGHQARNILQPEQNDPGDHGMHQLHLIAQSNSKRLCHISNLKSYDGLQSTELLHCTSTTFNVWLERQHTVRETLLPFIHRHRQNRNNRRQLSSVDYKLDCTNATIIHFTNQI